MVAEVVKDLKTLPKVDADPAQLQSVISNLVLNARDAVDEQGRVTIKTDRRAQWVT